MKREKVNITIALSEEENEDLLFLMNYFQRHSVSNVNRSDVIKYLLKRYRGVLESEKASDLIKLLREEMKKNE